MISRTIVAINLLFITAWLMSCRTPVQSRYIQLDSVIDNVRIIKDSYVAVDQDKYLSIRSYVQYQIDVEFISVALDTVDCSMIIKGRAFERETHLPLQGVQVRIGSTRISQGTIIEDASPLAIYHIISSHAQQALTDETGQFAIWGKASLGEHLFFLYPNYKMQIYEIDKLCLTNPNEN